MKLFNAKEILNWPLRGKGFGIFDVGKKRWQCIMSLCKAGIPKVQMLAEFYEPVTFQRKQYTLKEVLAFIMQDEILRINLVQNQDGNLINELNYEKYINFSFTTYFIDFWL